MSVRNRTTSEFERQASVDVLLSENTHRNSNLVSSAAKRVFFRRKVPLEILNDLPESSVDPLPGELENGGGVVDSRLSSRVAACDLSCGRAITVTGSPLKPYRITQSVDYGNRVLFRVVDSKGYIERVNSSQIQEGSSRAERSVVCKECSSGTFFGLYHTPTARRRTFDVTPNQSISDENRWERSSLPPQSSFTTFAPGPHNSTKVSQPYPDTSGIPLYHTKTFHCTPELRYKPVYFGDPRLRRFSCGYSNRRSAPDTSGLHDFCQTMLSANTHSEKFCRDGLDNRIEDVERDTMQTDMKSNMDEDIQNFRENHPQKHSKQSTPLRSPKLVKEVLKRMSSHPCGRDPQVTDTFSDEDDADFVVDQEAMKIIDDFDRSLGEIPLNDKINRPVQHAGPKVHATNGTPRDTGLQSDNLVEEVQFSERKYEKSSGQPQTFNEKYRGCEEIEEAKRFMSLSSDQKSKKGFIRDESPAPPKPPRNYDSLPRGFKAGSHDSQYDEVFSGIHPLNSSNSGSQGSASPQQNYFVVVAIDFGTTYSGYAFCFTQDSDNIHMMRKWEGGDPGVVNQKTPTTLLLDPEGRFHSFGYAARDCYHDLDPQEAKRWLYFEKFKMTLHKTEHLSRETIIYAANGKGVPALTVFAHALRYFKDHALQELSDQSATAILSDDVRWVVTVPAIWRQPAKQFMRTASYEAGIASAENPEQLLIALEPEAASIFCRRLRLHQLVPVTTTPTRLSVANIKEPAEGCQDPAVIENAGTRYMVVDCGGGTVDITVHEIIDENGTIKELHKATGGPYGSVGIDLEFEKLLDDIFGSDFMNQFKVKRPAGFVDLMVAFEARKRNASPFKITPINIALPFSFIDYYKKTKSASVEAAVKKYSSKEIKWSSQGMLRLEPTGMMNLFQPTLEAIKGHVANVLENCESGGISYLFLVGGFAESAILQKSIRDAFSATLKVIIPQGVSLAILKGAVLFGVDPSVVCSRRSRLTYGVGILNRFIHGVHPPDKLVVKDGVEWCADIFDKFVLADQSVCVGDTVIRRYTPARSGQACSVIHIYCSERDDVSFITDAGVKRCGTLVLDLPEGKSDDADEQQSKKREIQTVMIFGDTELKVSAMDVLTGKCVKAEVDFLNA